MIAFVALSLIVSTTTTGLMIFNTFPKVNAQQAPTSGSSSQGGAPSKGGGRAAAQQPTAQLALLFKEAYV